MSTNDHPGGSDEGDEDFLAGEYVLGVLDASARRHAELRMADDAAFARDVAAYEADLMPFTAEVAAIAAPEAVWVRVAEALAPPAPRWGVVPARAGLWQNLAFWRGLSVGAVGLAAASLVAVGIVTSRPVPPAPAGASTLVAALAPKTGDGHLMVTIDRAKGTVMVMPASMPMPPQHVAELWLIPPGGTPQAIGVVDAHKPMRMKIPDKLMPDMAAHAMLAVSIEPPGGSPTGKPTGPVVASGPLYVL